MIRKITGFSLLGTALLGLLPLACQPGGVGDPCTPEDEYGVKFPGYRRHGNQRREQVLPVRDTRLPGQSLPRPGELQVRAGSPPRCPRLLRPRRSGQTDLGGGQPATGRAVRPIRPCTAPAAAMAKTRTPATVSAPQATPAPTSSTSSHSAADNSQARTACVTAPTSRRNLRNCDPDPTKPDTYCGAADQG